MATNEKPYEALLYKTQLRAEHSPGLLVFVR
jgi:hypothetical protein